MKITLKYEESLVPELQMTLRLTLPQKYVNGPTKEVVKLFIDHYNKKHPEAQLEADALHLKIVGGSHLDRSGKVSASLANGDECYLLGTSSTQSMSESKAAKEPEAAAAPSKPKGPATDAEGRVRCKRFGCQKFFHPDGPEQVCVHHKSPPIFHETAKWWSCCSDKKAYDWEEFMRIPGCQTGVCSACPDGQNQKRFLGGSDLRGDSAPQRLDPDAPKDPRHRLADLAKGLAAIGIDTALFEKVWGKLAAQHDPEKACEIFAERFAWALNKSDS